MRFQSTLAFVLPALIIAAPTPENAIVGGTTVRAGEYPFIVSLRRANGEHFCGGSLLNANTIVTAAHCSVASAIEGPVSGLTIRAGSLSKSSGGTVVGVRPIIINPSYDAEAQNNDVAVWKLSTPISSNSTISYVSLPAAGSDPASGLAASVAGWGTLRSDDLTPEALPEALQRVDVPIVARTSYAAAYRKDPDFDGAPVTSNMVCAGYTDGGHDSCQGDSGGPLVDVSLTLIGVVSYGKGCALANFPSIYTCTSNFISFINANA